MENKRSEFKKLLEETVTFSKNCLLYSINIVPLSCSPGRSSPSYSDTGDESGFFYIQ